MHRVLRQDQPTPGARGSRVVLGAVVSLALAACSSQALEFFPQIDVTIEAQPGKTDWEFSPDTTGGQLSQQATVRIRNAGKGDLVLTSVDFVSANKFIKDVWPGGKPTMPKTLKDGEIQTIQIQFKPDPNIEDTGSAQLTIRHNDQDQQEFKLTFKVKQQGAKLVLDQNTLPFINPSKAAPPKQCVKFGNAGNAPLIFKKAYLATATPYYTIIETPNEGETIPALGEGSNPKSNPMRLQVCVRVSPEAKDADYSSKLIIETNDTSNPKATVQLTVTWEEDNKFVVSCSSGDGKIKYDFAGITAGVTERCCNIYNEGPSGFVVQKVDIKALDGGKQAIADAIFSSTLYAKNSKGDKEEVELPRSISPAKSLDFCVTFSFPNDSKTTNAETVIRYQQANIPDALQIPVIAGTCDTPDLVVAPAASAVWMDAKLGAKTTRELLVANQSCAPLQVLQVCTSQIAGGAGSNPCGNLGALSQHFFVDPDIGIKAVDPWGTLPITIRFEPPNEKYTDIQHYLHIVYCGGKWDGDKCSEPPVVNTLNLMGYVGDQLQLPSLTLAVVSTDEPQAGKPTKIEAAATAGQWPIGEYGAYLWFLAERPAGSTFWLSTEFQATNEPWITIKPDVAGKYRIVGAVQAVDPQSTSKFAWSPQTSLVIDVKP